VLIVDDEPHYARSLARLLQEEGFTVESCSTVAAALDLLRAHVFDVMLCDRRLPDGNGCALMRAALRIRPIKGIAVTGQVGEEAIAESRAAGFVEHLSKPTPFEAILVAIDRALKGSET
jgi:CheY-like chemotaxis protein